MTKNGVVELQVVAEEDESNSKNEGLGVDDIRNNGFEDKGIIGNLFDISRGFESPLFANFLSDYFSQLSFSSSSSNLVMDDVSRFEKLLGNLRLVEADGRRLDIIVPSISRNYYGNEYKKGEDSKDVDRDEWLSSHTKHMSMRKKARLSFLAMEDYACKLEQGDFGGTQSESKVIFYGFQEVAAQTVKLAKGTTLAFIFIKGIIVVAHSRASMGGYISS
ncbi:hypothetical protein SUGI_0683140 [Cryptomeria japonica]|nr:hypothetical protein SUGI_0683140 [Cryptomeria japonica]